MFFTDVLQCSIMVVGGIIVAIMSKKISFFLNVILFKFCFFLSLEGEEYIFQEVSVSTDVMTSSKFHLFLFKVSTRLVV